jgi:hypothetical protein
MITPFATATLVSLLLAGMIAASAWTPRGTVVVAPLLN